MTKEQHLIAVACELAHAAQGYAEALWLQRSTMESVIAMSKARAALREIQAYARYAAAEVAVFEAVEEYEGKPLAPVATENSPELQVLRAALEAGGILGSSAPAKE